MGAQCSVTPNPTTPAEFETTPSRIPAFLQEEQTDIQEDMGCDVVKKFSTNMMLQGSEGTTTDQNGEDTPSPFLLSDIEALQKDPLEEPWSSEVETPRRLGSGCYVAPGAREELRQTLQTQLAERQLLVSAREMDETKTKVLVTTLKNRVSVVELQGQMVATKRIKHDPFPQEDERVENAYEASLREMLQELRILMAIDHPCVVKLIGANLAADEDPIVVTEYMEGGDVEHFMFRQRQAANGQRFKPSLPLAMSWSISVAEALAYLHGLDQPIIHRDLKPLNLLLTKDLQVKITDFGISKVMVSTAASGGTDPCPAPVMTGGIGTWRYMAPEVVRHEPYTDRVDIFSFSLIVYLLFTGNTPFHSFCGNKPERILQSYLAGREPRPDLSFAFISPTMRLLKPFLEDAWNARAAARPSATECLARLQAMNSQGVLHAVQSRVRSMVSWKRLVTQ